MKVKKLGVKAIHPYSYRWNGFDNKGEVTGVFNVKPDGDLDWRLCYQITYPDGEVDYTPVEEFNNGAYKLI